MKFGSTSEAYVCSGIYFSEQKYTWNVSLIIPFHFFKVPFLARQKQRAENKKCAGYFEHLGESAAVTQTSSLLIMDSTLFQKI